MKLVEEKSVGGCPLPALASREYEPLAMGSFGTVNVRMASPFASEATLFRFFIVVFPDIQKKLTDVPAG